MSDLTQILIQLNKSQASELLLPLVYDELRQLAAQKLVHEQPGHTLQPTALVHEAYIRLVGAANDSHWENRAHFFAAAAQAMRRILIDEARKKLSDKRGGRQQRIELEENALLADAQDSKPDDLLALDEALLQFEAIEPLKAQLVKLRYFAGLTMKEAALALDISEASAKRFWIYSRSWLFGKIQGK